MAEENDKSVFNERVLAKLLEAAFVVQEHKRAEQNPEPRLESNKPAVAIKAAPPVSPSVSSEPSTSAEPEAVAPPSPPVSAAPISAAPVLTAPGSSSPVSAGARREDYASTLEQIVETQRQMRERRVELTNPLELIAGRVCEIACAGGAAVGIVEGAEIHYRATAGVMTPAESGTSKEKALCALCLQTGQVVRCADTDSDEGMEGIDSEETRRRGIRALIAVPVFHDGAVYGGLELYYATSHGFTEQDVHTAQLMAGLVTEALAREEEKTRRESLAGERALMLEALEKLQPNLAALVDVSAVKGAAGQPTVTATMPSSKTAIVCGKCGHELLEEEQFCGKCGSPRGGSYEPPSMQSKVASMWHMQEALKNSSAPVNGTGGLAEAAPGFDDAQFEKMLANSLEKEMPELFQLPEMRAGRMWPESPQTRDNAQTDSRRSAQNDAHDARTADLQIADLQIADLQIADLQIKDPQTKDPASDHAVSAQADEHEVSRKPGQLELDKDESFEEPVAVTALAKPEHNPDWSSAASAREFLEQLAAERSSGLLRFWHARRGDFYLALAVILVAVVIRWGIWSNHEVNATGTPSTAAAQQHRKPASDTDLSWFDRTLVKFGLADAPDPVEYKGNPQIQVWVDLHTALYYCPGTDLYGKTPKGKFTTQRDAQLDQFEPAYRKACE